jgi:hypothetical protein
MCGNIEQPIGAKRMTIRTRFFIAVLASAIGAILTPAQADEWRYELKPYLLLSSIDGDASVGRLEGADVAVDFDTILENLELGGMVHFEALKSDGLILGLDYGFMDLGADINIRGENTGFLDAGLRQGILEGFVGKRLQRGEGTLDYIGGLRWWDFDIDLSLNDGIIPGTPSANIEEDWIDVFVGARWTSAINDRLSYLIYGDVGGFGLESDFTAKFQGGLIYNLNESFDLNIDYMALWVDYETGTPDTRGRFAYDTVTHGPVAGFTWKF